MQSSTGPRREHRTEQRIYVSIYRSVRSNAVDKHSKRAKIIARERVHRSVELRAKIIARERVRRSVKNIYIYSSVYKGKVYDRETQLSSLADRAHKRSTLSSGYCCCYYHLIYLLPTPVDGKHIGIVNFPLLITYTTRVRE